MIGKLFTVPDCLFIARFLVSRCRTGKQDHMVARISRDVILDTHCDRQSTMQTKQGSIRLVKLSLEASQLTNEQLLFLDRNRCTQA